MRYLLLIYTPEADPLTVAPERLKEIADEYDVFTREVTRRGAMRTGEALYPTSAATTVRIKEGRTVITDGPFAETKEALAGFYLVDVRDLDEALELAAMIPGARWGSVEVRPIWEVPGELPAEGDPSSSQRSGEAVH